MTPRRVFTAVLLVLCLTWLVETFTYGWGPIAQYVGPFCIIGSVILTLWTMKAKRASAP